MDQQKQPTTPETKTVEVKPVQTQPQKVVLPQSDNDKPTNPSGADQAPESKETQTRGNA